MQCASEPLTYAEALKRAQNLCARQDRSHQYIRQKFYDWQVNSSHVEALITDLIEVKFLDEERFAKAYAKGKFNQNKWGRNKIKEGLKQHRIDGYCLNSGLNEISNQNYLNSINKLIDKKNNLLKESNQFIRNKKIANYLISKGYESNLVWDEIRKKFEL